VFRAIGSVRSVRSVTNRITISKAIVLVAGVLAAGGAVAWLVSDGNHRVALDDPAQLEAGRIIYAEHCASCHGAALEGQPNWRDPKPDGRLPAPPHDATGHTWHHPADMLFEITKCGIGTFAPDGYESDMPAFAETLTDEQIWAVLAYIASQWPDDVQARWRATSEPSG
jgi:mono/diheme cytochrome c family protein